MFREEVERAVRIDDHGKSAELRLIGYGFDDTAAGKTIDRERCDTLLIQLFRPLFN